MKKKRCSSVFSILILSLTLCACGVQSQNGVKTESTEQADKKPETIDFTTLTKTGSVELKYATQFTVDRYGVYDLITIAEDGRYLVIPEGAAVPLSIPKDIVPLQQPLNRTYLVSTAVMDSVCSIDALSNVRLSGAKEDSWYIEDAIQAMKDLKLLYAGKYSAPDYELLLSEGCDLAVENTMIYHNPEVKEKLESLGIPVLVERSSYETDPIGRMEWLKLFGILYDKEEEANQFFEEQLAQIEPVMKHEDTGKTVAFFYVTSNGAVNVRKPNDYIAQMIKLAGGHYALDDVLVEEENALSSMNMQMEDFYAAGHDADILIYNSTIDGELGSIDDLIAKNKLFAEFKAVKDGEVYCTTNNFFQKTTAVANFMVNLNHIFSKETTKDNLYLRKLR